MYSGWDHDHDTYPLESVNVTDFIFQWDPSDRDVFEFIGVSTKVIKTSVSIGSEMFMCFGKVEGEEGLCNDHGVCIGANDCECYAGFGNVEDSSCIENTDSDVTQDVDNAVRMNVLILFFGFIYFHLF